MLISLKEMLEDARNKKYAIPAFDVTNYEMIRCVIEICAEERSPAIFMCLKPDLEGNGLGFISAMIKHASSIYRDIPVCIHLDHAVSAAEIKRAIEAGFNSVMYDGSQLPFDQNVKNTLEVVEYAHKLGISVEAELGHVSDAIAGTGEDMLTDKGEAGQGHSKTPDESSSGSNNLSGERAEDVESDADTNNLTRPDEVVRFIEQTGVDALAVAIGTAHGVYRKKPELRFNLLEEINKCSIKPLVLHGGSGTPDEDIKKVISLGITKINIFSEMLNALNTGLRDKLGSITNMSMWSYLVYEKAIYNMRAIARHKISVFGSGGRI